MDFRLTEEEQALRKEMFDVCKELEKKRPEGWTGIWETWFNDEEYWEYNCYCAKEFAKKGWLSIDWPVEYGGKGHSKLSKVFLAEAVGYYKLPGVDVFGVNMTAPTLLMFGTDEQKKKFLPLIAAGEVSWGELWSEPNAGSDLANVSTSGVKKGDVYVVNGQKTWSSACHRADWSFMLFKTDPNAQPKHRGLSFILVDMKSPGITVAPLYFMNGERAFNEVFLDDVQVPVKNLLGEENKGWGVTRGLMNAERSGAGNVAIAERDFEDLVKFCRNTKRNNQPLSKDPVIRNRLAELSCEIAANKALTYRVAWAQDKGLMGPVEASAIRVFGSEVTIRLTYLASNILGTYGQVKSSKWAPLEGYYEDRYQSCFAEAIAAGTLEIQKNIIAWEGLGLPRMR